MNYLDLSNKIEGLSETKTSTTEVSNQNTEDCATKLGFYFPKTGKCYVQSYIKTKNWTEARTDCKRLGGDLATIGDQATEDFFMNITRDDEGGVFIGAEKKAGVWTWVDGSTWYGFGNWALREPASDDVVVMIGYKNGNTLWYGLLKERGGVNYLCQY